MSSRNSSARQSRNNSASQSRTNSASKSRNASAQKSRSNSAQSNRSKSATPQQTPEEPPHPLDMKAYVMTEVEQSNAEMTYALADTNPEGKIICAEAIKQLVDLWLRAEKPEGEDEDEKDEKGGIKEEDGQMVMGDNEDGDKKEEEKTEGQEEEKNEGDKVNNEQQENQAEMEGQQQEEQQSEAKEEDEEKSGDKETDKEQEDKKDERLEGKIKHEVEELVKETKKEEFMACEYIDLVRKMYWYRHALHHLKLVFKVFDSDGDGHIDGKDLCEVMAKVGCELTAGEVVVMMDEADRNKDGKLCFCEFKHAMLKEYP